MPEAEELVSDLARHATVFAQELWGRHQSRHVDALPRLHDVAARLDLLLRAVFGRHWTLRTAQPAPPPTFVRRLFMRWIPPVQPAAIPATDGASLWLPETVAERDPVLAMASWRTMALRQGMRATRGAAAVARAAPDALTRALYLLIEAHAADVQLLQMLPGLAGALRAVRAHALAARPALDALPLVHRPLEQLARAGMRLEPREVSDPFPLTADAAGSLRQALALAPGLCIGQERLRDRAWVFADEWTGTLDCPARPAAFGMTAAHEACADEPPTRVRSARLARTPKAREAVPDDAEDERQGAWMIQTSQPQEHVEDAMGAQRPTDRDASVAAEDFADSLAELPEARLVSSAARVKEVLASEALALARGNGVPASSPDKTSGLFYPEWDYRTRSYRPVAAIVQARPAAHGAQAWVDRTLHANGAALQGIRRRFELLRAQRTRLRRQRDGEDIDLEALVESHADVRAGLPRSQAMYQALPPGRRDLAVELLVDVSESTDAWIDAHRRIIDVEREALLLVSIALEGLVDACAIHAFSGYGPRAVSVRTVKDFGASDPAETRLRIAGLEPERYTRAGAPIRHVSSLLMRQCARHRLLLMLSDGKPNDIDEYEGRYGVEDMRQALTEARLQGIFPFCLTVDRQAPAYMPHVFGAGQYALLSQPRMLPTVLLEWLGRLTV